MSMVTLESIGRKIAKLRAEKGMSQEDLAGEAEVNRGYISRIENGHVAFSVPVLIKISEALNVKPEELFKRYHSFPKFEFRLVNRNYNLRPQSK